MLRTEPVFSVSACRWVLLSRNIAQRIAAVMGEVDYVQKEKKQGMNYSIVSHDAVTAKVRPLLHKHGVIYYPRGLTVSQNGNRTEAVFTVRFENIDDRTDYIDVETFGYGVDPQDKGPGKAMSYGVKYALLKVLGLETGDDPDVVQDKSATIGRRPAKKSRRDAPSWTALTTPCPSSKRRLASSRGRSAAWAAGGLRGVETGQGGHRVRRAMQARSARMVVPEPSRLPA
jgi:hypothetical protein